MATVSRGMGCIKGLGGLGREEKKRICFLFRSGDFSIAFLAQEKRKRFSWKMEACLEKKRKGAAWDES